MNRIFKPISTLFIEMGQMRWRWIAAANTLISHIKSLPKFPMVKEDYQNWRNFKNRKTGLVFSG